MIIDAHSHGLHKSYLDRLETIGGTLVRKRVDKARERRKLTPQFSDVPVRVQQLERHGIDLQMVTGSVALDVNTLPCNAVQRLEIATALNDSMARVVEESRGKLAAAGSIPLEGFNESCRQEMERVTRGLGLRAMNIPSNINGKPLDLPEFEPFWAHAEHLNVPVYIHPWAQPGRPYEADFDMPHVFGWPFETTITLARLVFSGIMERYPGLRIVSHHLGGGMIPFFLGRIVESNDPTGGWENMGPAMPKPLPEYFERFYYDTAVGGSAAAIRCAYEVFGPDHILFATDGPNGPELGDARLASYPGVIRSLRLPEPDTSKILADNAKRLLNLI